MKFLCAASLCSSLLYDIECLRPCSSRFDRNECCLVFQIYHLTGGFDMAVRDIITLEFPVAQNKIVVKIS